MDDVAYVRQTAESEFSKINLLKIDADEICRQRLTFNLQSCSETFLWNENNTMLSGFLKKYAVTGAKKE